MNQCLRRLTVILYVLFGIGIFLINSANANQLNINKKINQLDNDFKSLSTEFYQDKSLYTADSLKQYTDIEKLAHDIIELKQSDQAITTLQLIYNNNELIEDNIDTKSVFLIIELLLEKNEWNLAEHFYQTIKNEGDKSLLATVQFIFAKYYAQRNEWSSVHRFLDGIITELAEENTAYAYLLNGSALQHLKNHRLAVKNYNKIPKSSIYYRYAQLNIAIANIRQGWWTDAQTKIRQLIKYSNKTNEDPLTNRLYLILGYALLQREYYRDARDAFRSIGLKSRHTNRALLGIGLTAVSQGDFVGGLNALTILQDKNTFDLSVDESYLLVPYVYEKLKQEVTVTSSYSEAIKYFKQRISQLNNISSKHVDFKNLQYNKKTSELIFENNSFDYGKKYPNSFINNFKQLYIFQSRSNNIKLTKKINSLISRFSKTYDNIIIDLANQRISYLKSYLNQSRYGLARLYDNTNTSSGE